MKRKINRKEKRTEIIILKIKIDEDIIISKCKIKPI